MRRHQKLNCLEGFYSVNYSTFVIAFLLELGEHKLSCWTHLHRETYPTFEAPM